MSRTYVLGIDVSLRNLGMIVIDLDHECVVNARVAETKKAAKKKGIRVADDNADRCQSLTRALDTVIRTWQPAGAVVELPNAGARGASAIRGMALAMGVVVAVLDLRQLPAEWVTPSDNKLAACGSEQASKADVEAAMRLRFIGWKGNLPDKKTLHEHVFDAAGAVNAAWDGTLLRALRGMAAAAREEQSA